MEITAQIEGGPRNEKVETDELENEKYWPQILAILVVSLGSFSAGILFTWASPFSLVITQDKENYDVTDDDTSYFIIIQPVGMICGSLFIFKLLEFMGTKKAVIFLAAPQLCAWILSIFAKNKWTFYVMRFIGGIGDTWFFCSIPAYVGEISTPTVRGYFGNVPTFIFFGGEEFITVIGSYLGVKVTAYICMPIPVLFAILVTFVLPESPYQLIKDGKLDEARESIKWLRRKADIEHDFQKMEADVIRQISEPGTWKDLFTIPSNRKALRAGAFLRFTQLLSGIAIFVFYTQSLFEKAGGSISPQCSSIIFMGLLWTLNLVFSPGVEKFGRKLTYCYSSASSGVILLIMAAYFFLDQYQIVNLDPIKWFPLAGMIAFAFAYSFGQGIIPTLMLGELFSASIKLKGLAVIMTVFGISSFLTTTLFNVFTATIGLYSAFLVYGICCIITSVLTLRWVPETKGKTLEEIQQGLKN